MASGIRLWSGVLIATLAASPLGAEPDGRKPDPHPVLKPGPSAGVRTAQQARLRPALALVGAGAVLALVAVTTAGNSGKDAQPNNQSVPATVP